MMHHEKVRKRVSTVLDYVKPMVEHAIEREISAKTLRKLLGNHHDKETLANWLYSNLFQQMHFYQVGQFPYTYRANAKGYAKIKRMLDEA